jgi:hypothetical protein
LKFEDILYDNDAGRSDVTEPEPGISNPLPALYGACDNRRRTKDDKQKISNVCGCNDVCNESGQGVCHSRIRITVYGQNHL